MEAKDYVTLSIAAVGLALAVVNFIRTSRISDRQYVLAFSQDVYKWSSEVMILFKDTHVALTNMTSYEEARRLLSETCHKLSVTWDQGRFLFPNSDQDKHNLANEEAYKGLRRPILNFVAAFHYALEEDIEKLDRHQNLPIDENRYIAIRRGFVTEAQKMMRTNERFGLAGLSGKAK